MATTDTSAALAPAVAVITAVAAIGFWRTAHDAKGAALTLSRIERQRVHAAPTPHFRRTIVVSEARSAAWLW
ncbi:hypothetical protein [Streptomyces eurythermus]|uniref:hypothetical protein n=1 Tax=Streptomyces eurythermus TaxID=42237 RepID=UPI0033DA5671